MYFSAILQEESEKEFWFFSKTLSFSPLCSKANERCRFSTQYLVVMLHADTTNAFQMMSYDNIEKNLNRNKHLNLNPENKNTSLTAACFSQN